MHIFFQKDGVTFSKNKMWCPSSGLRWSIGMMSTGERVRIILPRVVVPIELPVGRFEDVWLTPLPNVKHVKDGLCVHTGSTETSEIGTVRSKYPIDPLSPHPFFEVKVVSCVAGMTLAIGVCEKEYPYAEMLGCLVVRSVSTVIKAAFTRALLFRI